MCRYFCFVLLSILCPLVVLSQITVRGVVKDDMGEPLIGATVRVASQNIGTITDYDGQFELNGVDQSAKVEISYAGFFTVETAADPNLSIVLKEDIQKLDEVIVVGYGTSKVKDLTAPISVVNGEELLSVPTSSAMSGLQGKLAGVHITTSGQPGIGPTVSIRGVGSFEAQQILYVVDGMFYDNINFLNSSDIENISIMKDASASAIYGVRAANGVVIVTTKKGKYNQRPQVTYDGYVGVQTVANRLKMASSNQYAEMLMEASPRAFGGILSNAMNTYGGTFDATANRYSLDQNTDWYDELLRNAIITNHSLSINGGGDKATYAVGVNYLYQNGIMNAAKNDYDRLNLRGQMEYKPYKWLTVGGSGIFSTSNQHFPNEDAWQKAFNMPGFFPALDESTADEDNRGYAMPTWLANANSNFYNPVAMANLYDRYTKYHDVVSNVFAQFNFIPDKLNLRTSYSYSYSGTRSYVYIPQYRVSKNQYTDASSLNRGLSSFNRQIWDNVLTYNDKWGSHALKVMLGLSMADDRSYWLSGTAQNVPEGKTSYYYLNQGSREGITIDDGGTHYRELSYFGRIFYSYADKYLLTLTLRRDGASKYNDPWGTFPSVGLGWVLTEEPWLKGNKVLNFLKLRASWGLLGNGYGDASFGSRERIRGQSVYGTNNAISGYFYESTFSWLSWEKINETNVGLSFALFDNRLTGDIDYYYKLTNDAVLSYMHPMYNKAIKGNWGQILNSGVDFNINWEHKVTKDWTYFVSGNVAWLHNEVTKLHDNLQHINRDGLLVYEVGQKVNSFYGLKVVGIYQTEEECANDPVAVANGLKPGDFRYEDVNSDGVINNSDKQVLGAYIPDITYGLNVGFRWRWMDLTVTFSGQAGGELWNKKRALRTACPMYNFDLAQYEDRWTGPGSTNSQPSSAALIKSWNIGDSQNASYFLESSDYFRLQNITLGWTFTNVGTDQYKMQSIRFSLTAEKPYTWFKAHTMTPEMTNGTGVDTEVFPQTATYTFSVQLKF